MLVTGLEDNKQYMIKKILIAFGTRPEFLKLRKLIDKLEDSNFIVDKVYIKQHSESFIGFDSTKFRTIEIDNTNSDNRLNTIQSSILNNLKIDSDTDLVVVHGDTATSFTVSLAAFNARIPVAHIEAGLRTYDLKNPYPEEMYRQLIDRLSSYRFCPLENDCNNLINEGLINNNFIVGNTIIDCLPDLQISDENKIYVTLHRRENHSLLHSWFSKVEKLAKLNPQYEFIFIKHPNPNVLKNISIFDKVKVIDPLPHLEFIKLLATKATLLISDSGGIQEEASHYNKKVLVCRETTERPYPGSILVKSPEQLIECFQNAINLNITTRGWFGVGESSSKISKILKELL